MAETQNTTSTQSVDTVWQAVDNHLRNGKKSDAIKIYQNIMDIDRHDAENIIEERYFTVHPEPNSKTAENTHTKSYTKKFKIILYWAIIFASCYFLMKDFLLRITLIDVTKFFIRIFTL